MIFRRLAGVALTGLLAVSAFAGPAAASEGRGELVPISGNGSERLCVGVEDLDGQNTTWVCTPEAQWYAQMIRYALNLIPA